MGSPPPHPMSFHGITLEPAFTLSLRNRFPAYPSHSIRHLPSIATYDMENCLLVFKFYSGHTLWFIHFLLSILSCATPFLMRNHRNRSCITFSSMHYILQQNIIKTWKVSNSEDSGNSWNWLDILGLSLLEHPYASRTEEETLPDQQSRLEESETAKQSEQERDLWRSQEDSQVRRAASETGQVSEEPETTNCLKETGVS